MNEERNKQFLTIREFTSKVFVGHLFGTQFFDIEIQFEDNLLKRKREKENENDISLNQNKKRKYELSVK